MPEAAEEGEKNELRTVTCVCGREKDCKPGMVIPLRGGNEGEGEGERENGVSERGFLS